MPDITIRINALIAYLFLGPIMLLAKKDTPLAHPYVRGHAKRATIIIIIGIIAFALYRLLRNYLTFGIFGVSLGLIIVTLIMSITVLVLIVGAYRAYSGMNVTQSSWKSFGMPLLQINTTE